MLGGGHGGVFAVAFGPGGEKLAGGNRDGSVTLWSADSGALLRLLSGGLKKVVSVAFSRDGKHLAACDDGKSVQVWEVESGRFVDTVSTGDANAVVFSGEGELISGHDGSIRWSTPLGKKLAVGEGHQIHALAISPDGKLLASGDLRGNLALWSPLSRKSLGLLFDVSPDAIRAASFSADGELLAAMRPWGQIHLFRVRDVDVSKLEPIPQGSR